MNSLDYSKTNTKKAAVATRVLSSHIAFDFLDNDD